MGSAITAHVWATTDVSTSDCLEKGTNETSRGRDSGTDAKAGAAAGSRAGGKGKCEDAMVSNFCLDRMIAIRTLQ